MQNLIADPETEVLVSSVSAFEIALKHGLGKMPEGAGMVEHFAAMVAGEGFDLLNVDVRHALTGGSLAMAHRDPFDRLLIAQALVEDVTLISNERLFDQTGVRRLW
jgi:PIN domain nuclease of toxin-antitoxin system